MFDFEKLIIEVELRPYLWNKFPNCFLTRREKLTKKWKNLSGTIMGRWYSTEICVKV